MNDIAVFISQRRIFQNIIIKKLFLSYSPAIGRLQDTKTKDLLLASFMHFKTICTSTAFVSDTARARTWLFFVSYNVSTLKGAKNLAPNNKSNTSHNVFQMLLTLTVKFFLNKQIFIESVNYCVRLCEIRCRVE